MQALAAAIVRWLLRHTVVLLIIIAVLLLGRAAWAQWTAFKAIRAEYPQLVQSDKGLSDHLELLITAATRRVLGVRVDSLQTLELRISDLTGQIARKQSAKTQSGTFAEILQGKPILQAQLDSLRLDAEINLLEEERSYLMELKLRVLATQSEKAHRDKLEQLREVHKSHYREWRDTKLKLEAFEGASPAEKSASWHGRICGARACGLNKTSCLLTTSRLTLTTGVSSGWCRRPDPWRRWRRSNRTAPKSKRSYGRCATGSRNWTSSGPATGSRRF
ncbi:MAG: hypothetical protein IPO43_00190 [Rhodoferax sp.]|nr:hypothetical protein [Rhodoferax sp.]